MANSDYTARNTQQGFCPTATLAAAIGHLDTSATMANFTSPIPEGVTLNMAAMIGTEIVAVLGRSGSIITIARGCCDTIPQSHAINSRIWFFDDSIGTDSIEYGATETIGVKLLPRTAVKAVPIAGSPPTGITFNWRFKRPYPPGLMQANGISWFIQQTVDTATPDLVLTWKHRDRVGQADQLVDYTQDNVGPEAGTTYIARVYKADNTLVRTVSAIATTTWTYDRATAMTDFVVSSGQHLGYVTIHSVRDAIESMQGYRIDFELDADSVAYPALSGIPFYFKFNGAENQQSGIVNSGTIGGTAALNGTQKLSTSAPYLGSASVTWSPGSGNSNVTLSNNAALRVLDGEKVTFGGWVKAIYPGGFTVSRSYSIYYIFAGLDFSGNQCYCLIVVNFRTSSPQFDLVCNNSVSGLVIQAPRALNNDIWNHFEFCIDGPTVYIFWNGSLVGSGDVGAGRTAGDNKVQLWPNGSTNPDGVTVKYDNIYVIPGVCAHTSSFTPPTTEFT